MTKSRYYRPAHKNWGGVHYPREAAETGWVGLSEITAIGDDRFVIIERDNQIGRAARIKTLTEVSLQGVTAAEPGSADIPVVEKRVIRDLIPDLRAGNGHVVDQADRKSVGWGKVVAVR